MIGRKNNHDDILKKYIGILIKSNQVIILW